MATTASPRQHRNSGWSPERCAAQSAAIRKWSPWKKSTGPRTPAGKVRSAQNAYKHGHRGVEWREIYALLAAQRRFVQRAMTIHKIRQLARAAQKNVTNELLDLGAESTCFPPILLGRSPDYKGKRHEPRPDCRRIRQNIAQNKRRDDQYR